MRFEVTHVAKDGLAREVWSFELDRFTFTTQIAVRLISYVSQTKPTPRHQKWRASLWYDPRAPHRSPGHLPHNRIDKEQDVPWTPEVGAEALALVNAAILLVEPERPKFATAPEAKDAPAAVCPRCLDVKPGTPAGSPEQPHPGPFTADVCHACARSEESP